MDWGVIETPILLTSTLNVGRVYDAALDYLLRKHPQVGLTQDVLIPLVGECDDSHMNRARLRPVGPREVARALDAGLSRAGAGPVAEGSVGAGAGMIAFDFKGGIGTSSRVVPLGEGRARRTYRVGVLLNANVGVRRQLRVAGIPVGREYRSKLMPEAHPERSVIVVVATDAPLRPDQLRRLCVRAGLGLGRAGSFAGHGSGELIVAFSTGLGEPKEGVPMMKVENLRDSYLNPFYEATVECVEESLLNAIVANSPSGLLHGRDGHGVHGVPIGALRERLK
jgi:D-aminopeptidase